ncbi:hypothetical protein CPC08DRAFT_103523 [Agrocybe pediades]|nr:hypothetical protein CPC08DRAFT_103523 [Agrocybe pediades]
MVPPPLSSRALLTWKICVTPVQALAISSTFLRLFHRWRIGKMWWDDWLAIFPLTMECLFTAFMWFAQPGIPHHAKIYLSPWAYRVQALSILCRMSLALSVARIFPPNHGSRRFALALAALSLFAYLCSLFVWTFACQQSFRRPWYNTPFSECLNSKLFMMTTTFAMGIGCDLILAVMPLVMLRRVRLRRMHRRLVLALLSSSLLTMLGMCTMLAAWFWREMLGEAYLQVFHLLGHAQTALSLLVCNLLVVAMFLYRIMRRGSSRQEEDYCESTRSSSVRPRSRRSVAIDPTASDGSPDETLSLTTVISNTSDFGNSEDSVFAPTRSCPSTSGNR